MKITWWILSLSVLWIYMQRTNLCGATFCSTTCLLVSNTTDIFTLDFQTSTINPVISGLTRAVAIDVHFGLGLVFWSDVAELNIKRLHIYTDNKTTIITNIGVCDGLAVERRTSQLFWTDKTSNSISVSDLDGNNQHAIISDGLDEPGGIALDLDSNFMFWTDLGVNPRIERANLSGSQRTAIVTTNLYHPNGLVLDKGNQRIFWVDGGLDRVESIDYNGRNRKLLFQQSGLHPFGVALVPPFLFFTDWNTSREVHKLDALTGKVLSSYSINGGQLMGVVGYDGFRQPSASSPCSLSNGGCSHFCVAKNSSYECVCPTGLAVKQNGKTCEETTTCPPLNVPPKAVMLNASCSNTNGSKCVFGCQNGYNSVNGNVTRTCLNTGNWSGIDINCTVINCPTPVVSSGGPLRMSSCGNHYGAQCSFSCPVGYRLKGSSSLTCVSSSDSPNGFWDNPLPSCHVISCGPLVPPTNVIISPSSCLSRSPYNQTCTFSCRIPGSVPNGTFSRLCGNDGKWTGSNGIRCRVPFVPWKSPRTKSNHRVIIYISITVSIGIGISIIITSRLTIVTLRRSFKRNIEVPLGDPNNLDAPRRDCYEVPDHTIIDIGGHNHQNENGNILSKLIFSTKRSRPVIDPGDPLQLAPIAQSQFNSEAGSSRSSAPEEGDRGNFEEKSKPPSDSVDAFKSPSSGESSSASSQLVDDDDLVTKKIDLYSSRKVGRPVNVTNLQDDQVGLNDRKESDYLTNRFPTVPVSNRITQVEGYFGSSGGELSAAPDSDVKIVIGNGVIEDGQLVFYGVVDDETELLRHIPVGPEETLISPMIECGPHDIRISEPLEIIIPHCLYMDKKVKKNIEKWISVYRTNPGPIKWEKIPYESEKNDLSKAWFTATEESIHIKTKTFSFWSIFSRRRTRRKRARVFASKPNPRSVYLRFYIYDDNEDSRRRVENQEKRLTKSSTPTVETPFLMYDNGSETINVRLTDLNGGWKLRTEADGHKAFVCLNAHGRRFQCEGVCDFVLKQIEGRVGTDFDCTITFQQEGREEEHTVTVIPNFQSEERPEPVNDPRQDSTETGDPQVTPTAQSHFNGAAGSSMSSAPGEGDRGNFDEKSKTPSDSAGACKSPSSGESSSASSQLMDDDHPVTEKICSYISHGVGSSWKNLLRELGLKSATIEQLEENYNRAGVAEVCFQGLLIWMRDSGGKATCRILREALASRPVGRSDLLEQILVKIV